MHDINISTIPLKIQHLHQPKTFCKILNCKILNLKAMDISDDIEGVNGRRARVKPPKPEVCINKPSSPDRDMCDTWRYAEHKASSSLTLSL